MTDIPTPFGSQAGKYKFLGTSSLTNSHAELQGDQGRKRIVIVPSDGLVQFSDVTESPCRGFIYLEDLDLLYTIHSSSAYKVNSAGVATRIGTIPGIDRVQLTRNKKTSPQITVRCDAGLYYIEDDQVRIINDPDLPETVSVETLGEFTFFGIEDGRIFNSSQSETTQIDALSFVTAEQSADKLIRLKVDRGELLVFSQYTIEIWTLTGNTDSVIQYRTLINRGLLARDTVQSCDGTLMFAGLSKEGEKGVYRLEGYAPKKISNHEVDRLIESETDPSALLSFSYGKAGHSFYVLKGTNWTRTYDAATQQWHGRKSKGVETWRAQYSIGAWNKVIVGDQQTGKLFYLDPNTNTEDGEVMVATIICPTMHLFPKGGIVDRLDIDFLVGQGRTLPADVGYEPMLMLERSTDGGNTYHGARHLKMGRQGAYETRVRTRRMGRFGPQGVVWRLSVSDPVGRALALLDASVRPLAA